MNPEATAKLFNKLNEVPTLVGNWQEERALKDVTGISRMKTWVPLDTDGSGTLYATRVDKGARDEDSFPRVVEHREKLYPPEWVSSSVSAYQHPGLRADQLAKYIDLGLGRRGAQELASMMAEAKALPPPVPDTSARLSEYKDTFRAHDDGDVNATSQTGRRRMRNQDGGPAAADLIFLTEGQLISPATASRMAAAGGALGATTSSLGRTAALPNPDVPITIYSEAVAKGTYTNTWTPGSRLLSSGTAAMSTASPGPFARYTNFSKPMSDFTKDPSNE